MKTPILLTKEEKRFLCELEAVVLDYDREIIVIPSRHRSIESLSAQELLDKAFSATIAKMIPLAIKLLMVAEGKTETMMELHRVYRQAIDSSYKNRQDSHCLSICIDYCYKDIKISPALQNEAGVWPPIYSYERLAIIYEKQKALDEAIEICKMALCEKLPRFAELKFAKRLEKLEQRRAKKEVMPCPRKILSPAARKAKGK